MSVYEASHGGDGRELLIALRDRLAADLDAAEAPNDVSRLAARLVEVVRELGVEPAVKQERGTVLDELRARRQASSGG